jgi:hypothetical protein
MTQQLFLISDVSRMLRIADPRGLKKWLGFLLFALGERLPQEQTEE